MGGVFDVNLGRLLRDETMKVSSLYKRPRQARKGCKEKHLLAVEPILH
jgi:hypothetical protein